MKTEKVVPFVALFAEKKVEYPANPVRYSHKEQRGLWKSEDLSNPLRMGPTQLHTPGGDSIGDQTC